MTASQRPERVDRAALVETTAKAIHAAAWEFGGDPGEWWEEADEMDRTMATEQALAALDAVLPLIADAIEDPIRLGESVHYEFCSLAQAGALVRSLLGTDGDR